MRGDLIRILSDVHFGDRASRVQRLAQLRPLVADTGGVIFNGDTLDTRPGPHAKHTAACREAVLAFSAAAESPITYLTGNHDPDFSAQHSLELNGGEVFVIHGDVLFDDIVPWGRDAKVIRAKLADALNSQSTDDWARIPLEQRVAIWREVARSIPQRHQSEQDPVKYALRFIGDTIWPPTRFFKIFGAWDREPRLAADLARIHRPSAQYIILGHTHRPSIRRSADGRVIINTGSFTAPFGGYTVDLSPGKLVVRRVQPTRGEFRPGRTIAEFPLAKH